MDRAQAEQRAQQYTAHGFPAKAVRPGWPKTDAPWCVEIQGWGDHYYDEFDVRVTSARTAWVRQYAAKPGVTCRCGYDPMTRQDLDDHIENGGAAHGLR